MGQVQKGATITPPKFTGIEGTIPVIVQEKYLSIDDYMLTHVNYPEEAVRKYAMGTEEISFSVTTEGKVADIKILNSVHRSIDDEVIRVLETTNGRWMPGFINGEAQTMETEISIVFRFDDRTASETVDLAKKYFSRGCENLFLKHNPKLALRGFNKGVVLLPKDKGLLALRGLTRYELGDKNGALDDWTKLRNLGGKEGEDLIKSLITMNGYEDKLVSMTGFEEMSRYLTK
jgi:TonB family protein